MNKIDLYLVIFDDYTKMKKIRLVICQLLVSITNAKTYILEELLYHTNIPSSLLSIVKNGDISKPVYIKYLNY